MKVYIKGQGEITLGQREFFRQGGEGQIYIKGNTAYKIYIDPAKMLPLGKITELSVITDPNVIRPVHIIEDGAGKPLGFTMPYKKNAVALCQTFTSAWRTRSKITPQQV